MLVCLSWDLLIHTSFNNTICCCQLYEHCVIYVKKIFFMVVGDNSLISCQSNTCMHAHTHAHTHIQKYTLNLKRW